MFRDQFGFQKLAVVVTSTGSIFGIDSANGNIVWSTLLNDRLEAIDMWIVRGLSEKGNPTVAVIGYDGSQTLAYHVDAITGKTVDILDQEVSGIEAGKVIAQGRSVKTFMLPVEHCKTKKRAVAIIDQDDKVSP